MITVFIWVKGVEMHILASKSELSELLAKSDRGSTVFMEFPLEKGGGRVLVKPASVDAVKVVSVEDE